MKNVDYIVVGLGLSGLSITEHLIKNNQSIVVFDQPTISASKVAGGMYNPVILKRFTLAWNAQEQLDVSNDFYNSIAEKLNILIDQKLNVYRRFNSVEEQNNWFTAMDKPGLERFLSPEITKIINPKIKGEHGFGLVQKAGLVNTTYLLETYTTYLQSVDSLIEETFDYDALDISPDNVTYKGISAKGIIFCEGFGVMKNPYFSDIDIRGNKGEYMIIESESLQLDAAVKSNVFIIPLGNNLYKVGASYDRDDLTYLPTTEKQEELINQLEKLTDVSYRIIDQIVGIRPTTKDRRPYIGNHTSHTNLFICNGLGSRGVMTAPVVGKALVDYIIDGKPIPNDINIKRHA